MSGLLRAKQIAAESELYYAKGAVDFYRGNTVCAYEADNHIAQLCWKNGYNDARDNKLNFWQQPQVNKDA